MSVVKDVDLEAMPTSIFLNNDHDDDEGHFNILRFTNGGSWGGRARAQGAVASPCPHASAAHG